MTKHITCELGTSARFPVIGEITSPVMVYDGAGIRPSEDYIMTVTPGSSVSFIQLDPQTTGEFFVLTETALGQEMTQVSCVRYSEQSLLNTLLDYHEGNWEWDKTSNVMSAYKRNGDILKEFDMVATAILTSRTAKP